MTFKVFNVDSIILVTYEGKRGDDNYLSGTLLTRREVDYLIRNLSHVLDAIKNAKDTYERIPVFTFIPDAVITTKEDIKMQICEMKTFTKYELQVFVDSVPALARWV